MSDSRPEDLEQEVRAHRADLANSLSALVEATDLSRNGDHAMQELTRNTQALANKTARAAKENPAGIALVGLGLAVLAMSPTGRKDVPDTRNFDDRIANADQRMRLKDDVTQGRTSSGQMQALLDRGLDKLGPEARERVKSARLKAIDAQERLEKEAARLSEAASETHRRQPLLSAAIAAGIGGLIGALLPTTRREGELLGAHRDALMRDAEAVLRSELSSLTKAGADAVSERLSDTPSQSRQLHG